MMMIVRSKSSSRCWSRGDVWWPNDFCICSSVNKNDVTLHSQFVHFWRICQWRFWKYKNDLLISYRRVLYLRGPWKVQKTSSRSNKTIFSFFLIFAVKVGLFTILYFFLHLANMQAYQQKTEKFFVSEEKKFIW
jgi:hypothetical protein